MVKSDLDSSECTSNLSGEPVRLPRKYVAQPQLCPVVQTEVGDTLVKFDEKIRNRWLIKKTDQGLIGSGGYGEIYYAIDQKMNESVAVKVEPIRRKGKIAKRMILEQKVLLRLQGCPHAPLMWGSGVEREINYIVMQLLSTNINDLRKRSPYRRFSRSTGGRIMQQAIAGLRDMHKIGYIHRDVKPANICFGLTEKSQRRLIIVDYGLVRRFRKSNGQRVEQRARAGFRGTLRYVSMRVHDRMEQGPSDDMIALFFSLIELLKSELPWRDEKSDERMKKQKLELLNDDFVKISENIGYSLREFGRVVMTMSVDDEPNYVLLQTIMKTLAHGRHLSEPYDWENHYVEVLEEQRNAIVK